MTTGHLDWTEYTDDDDNSWWESPSPFHDEGEHFLFRLKQRLRNNRIEWYDASDAECTLGGESWLSLEEAKAACEQARLTVLSECE